MGRWSQRRRAGGGKTAAVAGLDDRQLAQGLIHGDDRHFVTMSYTPGLGDFLALNPADFNDATDGGTGVTIHIPITATSFVLELDVETTDGALVTYAGTTPGFASPDSIGLQF